MLYVGMTRAIRALEMNQNLLSFLDVWKRQTTGKPFQLGTLAPAGAPPVALKEADRVIHAAKAGVPATNPGPATPEPHLAEETAIEKFIVRTGRFDEQLIAKELGVPVDNIVATAVRMILDNRLCLSFWEKNPVVMPAFLAHFRTSK